MFSQYYLHDKKSNRKVQQKSVKLQLIPDEEIEKLYKKKKTKIKSKQIVNNEDKKPVDKKVESKFLSKSNQHFHRQTVAKNVASHKRAGKGVRNAQNTKNQPAKVVKQKKPKYSLSDLGLGRKKVVAEKPSPKPKRQVSASQKKGIKFGDADKTGLAANSDFIEDIPLGDMTNLNTQEFKFFGFYDRIRKRLEQHWGYSIKEMARRIFKQGRKIASDENFITSLVVNLDEKGNIIKIKLNGSSGIQELDKAAINSFNEAGPFPNPPKGMLKNGVATIQWGFVVKS